MSFIKIVKVVWKINLWIFFFILNFLIGNTFFELFYIYFKIWNLFYLRLKIFMFNIILLWFFLIRKSSISISRIIIFWFCIPIRKISDRLRGFTSFWSKWLEISFRYREIFYSFSYNVFLLWSLLFDHNFFLFLLLRIKNKIRFWLLILLVLKIYLFLFVWYIMLLWCILFVVHISL